MNIAIAEDHALIIEGIVSLLSNEDYKVHCAQSATELFQCLNLEQIDLIIQDIRFGAVDARTIIPEIRSRFPSIKIIALTSLEDTASIQSVLALNVSGYVLKSEDPSVLLEAIRQVGLNKVYLSQEVQQILSKHKSSAELPVLSQREQEVLTGILDEQSTKEIAEKLFVSEKTVEHYRASLFSKFDVKNVSGLVKKAILLGYYSGN